MKCTWLEATDPDVLTEPAQPAGAGEFWSARWSRPHFRRHVCLGGTVNWRRGLALYRSEPFWLRPRRFDHVDQVPKGTQWLLIELTDGKVVLIAPLSSAPFHVTLCGSSGKLWASVDSGDPAVMASEALLLYVAVGDDVFALAESGAQRVAARLGVPLAKRSNAEAWADHFGWCTWEAFGQNVSQAACEQGLTSLAQRGVPPRFVILDDGWQSTLRAHSGEERLAAFGANSKFPGGLGAIVSNAKERHGVQWFFVWHTIHGYWGGLSHTGFGFDPTERLRWYPPEVLQHKPSMNCEPWGPQVGVVPQAQLQAFYGAYHAALRHAGVDGIKLDNQASIEALSQGDGGRVAGAHAVRAAAQRSAQEHFEGRLLHCMSCSTDLLYAPSQAGLTRSSQDFSQHDPAAHGQHLEANALFGIWFGQFARVDWDMFVSAHPSAALHAAGRALSGGPVYVSDLPGQHDPTLLRRLVLPNGEVLRAADAGRISCDNIFDDPLTGPGLLKIWNKNATTAVLGLFHPGGAGSERRDCFAVAEIPGSQSERYALYFHYAERVQGVGRTEPVAVRLAPLSAEVVTIAPLQGAMAVFGLRTQLNGGAAVISQGWVADHYEARVRLGGELVAYAERKVESVQVDGRAVAFTQGTDGMLRTSVPSAALSCVCWTFAP